MNKKSILNVRNLCKNYGDIRAVDSLSFTVDRGSIFGLLGPNGAGKTTSLECILGTQKADSGGIRMMDRQGGTYPKSMFERIGVQFQESHYPDRIRVNELVGMTASLYRGESADINLLLEQFGLVHRLFQPVDKLSGGEKQKLSVLLALINNPEIVFLDELTTGLDPGARREVWSHLEKLKDKGMTVILTSHFMDEVTRLCDRILIMKEGKEVVSGTPEEVIEASGEKTMEEAYLHYTGEEGGYNENISYSV